MALNSWQFLLLAAVAVLVLPGTTGRARVAGFLVVNSVFAWSHWGSSGMLIALGFLSTGYVCARLVRGRSAALLTASAVVLTLIFVYLRGYQLGGRTGGPSATSFLAFAGLSFMFFKIVHVVVDSASGAIGRLSLQLYANYCLNFTTVLMGPIQRYQDFADQWGTEAPRTFEEGLDAFNRVLRGLVKAFALAPAISPWILSSGVDIPNTSPFELWYRTCGFYVFLYLDFSGYCDIVIGIARLMGFRLTENFDFPFLSRNVSEYWLRVHRSLTQWLTDYVFTPMYGTALRSRWLGARPLLAAVSCLMLTMLMAGLWHGFTPAFVMFGLIHGAALSIVRVYDHVMVRWLGRARFRDLDGWRGTKIASTVLTHQFTSLAYAFFVLDIHDALRLFGRIGQWVLGVAR